MIYLKRMNVEELLLAVKHGEVTKGGVYFEDRVDLFASMCNELICTEKQLSNLGITSTYYLEVIKWKEAQYLLIGGAGGESFALDIEEVHLATEFDFSQLVDKVTKSLQYKFDYNLYLIYEDASEDFVNGGAKLLSRLIRGGSTC
jgi:hypothetical protein